MKKRAVVKLSSAILLMSGTAMAEQVWDSGGGADQNWSTAANWGGEYPDAVPGVGDSATIDNGGMALYSSASGTTSVLRTDVGGGSTLNITGGSLSNTKSSDTVRNNVGSLSTGTVNQSGGSHDVGHMLRTGYGSGGNGIYNLTGGVLQITRGGSSAVPSGSYATSLDVGVGGGTGLFRVSGGLLETRVGVGIGANGTFRVEGGAATSIAIGSYGSVGGHWVQDAGGTLSVAVDTHGLTPIFIDAVDDGAGGHGDVIFAEDALLNVAFMGGLDTFGVWDVMQWEGTLMDNGLTFDPVVDTNQWNFFFADTTGSGSLDTLRVTSVVDNAGTWIDADTVDVSWTDVSKWNAGRVAYGPDQVAYFDALNHVVAKGVDLPVDIVIGTIRYRDNGSVNRDMTIRSDNGSKLIMAGSISTPKIWARNRTIHVDVPIMGTNGLELAATQSTGSVLLKQRNRYSGTTTILDDNGPIKTVYPGDFGNSDLVVQGLLSIDHGKVLKPSANLTVDSGATLELAFAGASPGAIDYSDLFVSGLTLGDVALPDGIYSAATHPAFFSGTGEIVVQPVMDDLLISINATNALYWPSHASKMYEVYETFNLVSSDWNRRDTVPATVPTNVYSLGPLDTAEGFYSVTERPDYLPAARAGVIARIDGFIGNNYLTDQNLTVGDIRHGQFHSSDNMRMSECTPVLVWAYMQPDSQYYKDPEVLNRAIWSVDYMCRAQGINGGFNEYHGWCGVPNRTNGKSSVVGFTLHALGNAISLMAGLPEMATRLSENMDPNGTGSNDTERRTAWKNMLSQAMPFQFSGSGRGHAPNQDLCALMGVYAVNQAYAALDTGTLLKTQVQIDVLSNEIFYGTPSAASSNPDGKWFSSTGMLGEHGHEHYGYDGNYGAIVSFHYMGVLALLDTTSATFLSTKYAEALKYFFVPDEAASLGIYAENGISRRSTGDPLNPRIYALGVGRAYHPSLQRMHDIMLPHFAAAPEANMEFSSPSHFQVGVWGFCEWVDGLTEPENTTWRLPAEEAAAVEFRDETMKLLVTKTEGGVPVYYTEIWDAADQGRRHITGQAAETIDTLNEFP